MTDLNDDRPGAMDRSTRRQRSPVGWIVGAVVACLLVVMVFWGLSGNSDLGTTARPNTGSQQSTTGAAPTTPSPPASSSK
jgi:hypothetical protein